MKKFNLFILALLLFMPLVVNAQEAQICKLYESGTKEVDVLSMDEFENSLKLKVQELNKDSYGHYTHRYVMNVVDTTETTKKSFYETVEVSEVFEKKTDAVSYFDGIKLEKPYVKGEYVVSPKEIITTSNGATSSIVCLTLDCASEIDNLKKSLTSNQELVYDITAKSSISVDFKDVKYTSNNETVYFDTEEEANDFAENYTPTLDGYEFVKNEVKEETITITEELSYSDLNDNDTFETEELANEKLQEFQREYNINNGSVSKVRNNNDTTTRGILKFENQSELEKWLEENSIDSSLGKLTTVITPVKGEEESISGTYTTLEELENYIKSLEDLGYIVDYDYEKVFKGISGEVKTGEKFDSATRYQFSYNDTNYILIKQGSGNLALWTEYALSETEKDTFVRTYNSINNFDGSTSNITKDQITWINGFKAHDLSFIGNNWGTYTFTKEGNNIVMTCDKISHLIKGYSTPKFAYVLSGTKYRETEEVELSYVKTVYGFSYVVNATAFVEEEVTKYVIISKFIKEISESTATLNYYVKTTLVNYEYSLKYDVLKEETNKINKVNYVIEECGYENDIGGPDYEYPNPPYTGINTGIYTFVKILLGLSIVAVLFKIYKLVKNN
ncbi:MAG: hypothetical protein PUC23_03985 [bacterium]|nr:hypothetical protein [bacterium]